MNLGEIIKRFSLFSHLPDDKTSRYLPVILGCKDFFQSRMGERDYTESELRRLETACAAYAYYKVSLLEDDAGMTAFKAGDVQFSCQALREKARIIWENEKKETEDLIDTDGGAVFRAVRA